MGLKGEFLQLFWKKSGDGFFDPESLSIVPPVVVPDFLKSLLMFFSGVPKTVQNCQKLTKMTKMAKVAKIVKMSKIVKMAQ